MDHNYFSKILMRTLRPGMVPLELYQSIRFKPLKCTANKTKQAQPNSRSEVNLETMDNKFNEKANKGELF